ncbi:alkaline phosphatase family protein [Ferrimonas sp.]|uniref:alkaline phosphatase family protein n=1 Tax=Ferrimonas sp. TaxID=2080861 RepID=UPI003A95A2AE
MKSALIASLMLSASVAANPVSQIPGLGGAYHASQVLKEEILSAGTLAVTASRDAALFTIGGTTLDAYILTLPLDGATKTRVIKRLANPMYAIQLGHFLYMFKERYGGYDGEDQFKQHLLKHYSTAQLSQYQHSLFTLETPGADNDKTEAKPLIDDQFIATLVSMYDALFNNDEWVLGRHLPDHYRYLGESDADQALIARIQPLVIGLLERVEAGMEPGEFKNAVREVIADNAPEQAGKLNNKAEAITITLIDFVRYNVLKSYRQFVWEESRAEAQANWMTKQLDQNPKALVDYLTSRDQRRFAVQVTVDGLQQGLMAALVAPEHSPFLSQALAQHHNRENLKPKGERAARPEHQQQLTYLTQLVEAPQQDEHYLPFFRTLYAQPQGIVQHGVSTTPTISVRNLPIIKTGADVAGNGGTGIPNFHFVDRLQDRAYYFYGNDALQLERLFEQHGAKTMFDRLDHLKTMSCNAQYDWNSQVGYDALVNLGLGEVVRDFGERRCARELARRAKVHPQLQSARTELLSLIADYQATSWLLPLSKASQKRHLEQKIEQLAQLSEQGMPDYLLIYNPWPDHFAHFKGPFSDEIIAPTGELNRLDYWLGEYDGYYRQAGISQRTLWGMAGDHGLTPIYWAVNPQEQALEPLQQKLGYPLKIRKISSDEGEGPKITNAHHFPSSQDLDLVIASTAGGNFMLDLFNSHSGWQTQPLYRELTQWQPSQAPEGSRVDLIAELTTRLASSLDYLAVRETPCTTEMCTLRLVAQRDGQRRDELIQRHGDRLHYRSADARTAPVLLQLNESNPWEAPLDPAHQQEKARLLTACLDAPLTEPEQWCTSTQWQQLTRLTPRPDSVNQLAHLYDEDRAGTINLFPAEGVGYNTLVPGRHAGEHYLEKDAFLGFWGAPIEAEARVPTAINGSLAPTLYEYLTGEPVIPGVDGWGFPSLWPQLKGR